MAKKKSLPSLFGMDNRTDDLFHNLQNEVDRVFGQFRSGWPNALTDSSVAGSGNGMLVPRVNVSEADDAFEVEVELPGFESKDIEVTTQQRSLVIEAHKKAEKEEKKKNYHLVERSSGHYRRVIPLGFEADADAVKAKSKDGLLTVTVPKPVEAKKSVKRIQVESA